jgi:hypothetical protein
MLVTRLPELKMGASASGDSVNMSENELPRHRDFLTARWANLCMISYPVDQEWLRALLPPGCVPDLRDGRAFVSLVAFDFLSTRVMGISWPLHRNFPEVNLRFYVRHGDRRGVCFVREFVPKRVIATIARLLYNEPYRSASMSSRTSETPDMIEVKHDLTLAGVTNRIRVIGNKPAVRPDSDSVEHFFKEHSWGFGTSRHGRLLSYQVDHPTWDVWPVKSYEIDWDWKGIYGPDWAFLASVEPWSVVLARGSDVRVFPKALEAPEVTRRFSGA